MSKDSRAGKKYGGSHTSLIPAAALLCDAIHIFPTVTKISPGFIKAGLRSIGGQKRVKITKDTTHILLSIRDNISHQEVRIYAQDIDSTSRLIEESAHNAGFKITKTKP